MITDSGRTVRCIRGFPNEINQLLCSLNSGGKAFVASTTNQIKIYEYDKFTKMSDFTFRNEMRIKFIKCLPHDDKLLVVLSNDTICIFNAMPLKLIRNYDILKAKDKYLRRTNNIEMLNYTSTSSCASVDGEAAVNDGNNSNTVDDDRIIKSVTRDYQNGIITDITFHSNGNIMCVSFLDNSIVLCSITLWDVRRVIAYPDFYTKQCQFIQYANGNGNNVLLTLTSNDEMMLTCMSDLNSRMLIDMNNVFRFFLSANGRLLINLDYSGELLVYNLENHLNALTKRTLIVRDRDKGTSSSRSDEHQRCCRKGLVEIQMKVNESLATKKKERSFYSPFRNALVSREFRSFFFFLINKRLNQERRKLKKRKKFF